MTKSDQKCGFVAILGAPNAGKSTFLNKVVGQKVSIVTHKSQTTRSRITGIAIHDNAQIVFHDLPGIFEAQKKFDKAMVKAAWNALTDVDVGLVMVDASRPLTAKSVSGLLDRLETGQNEVETPLVLVLNKTDMVEKDELLPITQELNDRIGFEATFMISAKTGKGCGDVMQWLAGQMPPGPWMYDKDDVTDLPAKLLAAEMTREKIFQNLHQEIPYGTTVQTDDITFNDNGSITIDQVIFVRRDNHKAMVIGKGGQTLKRIGTKARKSLEKIFDARVHLNLLVRVNERWDEDPETYEMWGLEDS